MRYLRAFEVPTWATERDKSQTPRRWLYLCARVLFLLLVFSGCVSSAPSDLDSGSILRVGVLPDRARDGLLRVYGPLLAHLKAHTGLQLEILLSDNYEELLEDFAANRIQVARMGGLTFVLAEERSGALPLVLRDIDLEFTSAFITAPSSTAQDIQAFKARSFSFGPRLSTSGHLMPHQFLRRLDIQPESFFGEVRFSEGHDRTIQAVQDGDVELGVVSSVMLDTLIREGQTSRESVRVLTRTPPYTNYVWAVRPEVAEAIRVKLLDAFLSLDPAIPGHAYLLSRLGARVFIPASPSDFDEIRAAARAAGLTGEVER